MGETARTVAVLGIGGMGIAMSRRLLSQGCRVVAWDRTRDKSAALESDGATVADSPSDAVRDADVVLTMLRDGDAVRSVAEQFLDALPERAVWVQCSTVGAEAADALRALADENGSQLLDAPVSGSTAPAEQGKLTWLVSGPDAAVETARPVLEALGTVRHVGQQQEGSRLKLVVNAWMTAATVAWGESLAVCDRLGVDREQLLDVLDGGPLGMPYLSLKAQMLSKGEYPAGFPTELALKDVELALAAGAQGVPTLEHVAEVLRGTVDAGHAREDVGVLVETTAPRG